MSLTSADCLDYDDLAKVYDAIYSVRSKWDNLGLQLGILGTDIDAVKRECRGDVGECLHKLLSMWLKKADPKPTWKTLIIALKSKTVGFGSLAEELECKQVLGGCNLELPMLCSSYL